MGHSVRTCLYDKVAYRKVNTARSKEIEDKMRSFMAQTLGKSYEISFQKLCQRQTVSAHKETPETRATVRSSDEEEREVPMNRVQKVPDSARLSTPSRPLVDQDRTFFCSELVAKAFKILKFMDDDGTSCAKFYPSHFSSNGDNFLKLAKGTSLGPERLLDLDMIY